MDGRHTLLIGVASVVLDVYAGSEGSRTRNIRLVANTLDVIESREEFADVIAALGSSRWATLVRSYALRTLPLKVPDSPVVGEWNTIRWSFDGERTEIEAFQLSARLVETALLSRAG